MFEKTYGLPIGPAVPYKGKLPLWARILGWFGRPWVIVELVDPSDYTWHVIYQPSLWRRNEYRPHDWFAYYASAHPDRGMDIAFAGHVGFVSD